MSKAEFRVKSQSMVDKFKPSLIKLRAVHSKNPYFIKPHIPLMPEERFKPRTLNGFFILKMSKTQLPSEVVTLDLSEQNINKIDEENFQFFSNLIELNLSHNHLSISPVLSRFENLEVLNLQGNNI